LIISILKEEFNMSQVALTPKPPYYAVIFTSVRTPNDFDYSKMAEKMVELVKDQKGFLGMESVREELGITISYWETEDDVRNWKNHTDHLLAQSLGKELWYNYFKVRVCKVERDYEFSGK
jgi:heme-degrading monooxygenase HmoA